MPNDAAANHRAATGTETGSATYLNDTIATATVPSSTAPATTV
jgi:hypothetical protein